MPEGSRHLFYPISCLKKTLIHYVKWETVYRISYQLYWMLMLLLGAQQLGHPAFGPSSLCLGSSNSS